MTLYWSTAQTHPQQEALAIRNLRRQGYHAFYPLFVVPNRVSRRMLARPRPVFPGYVFIELDDEVYNWSPINSTLGITRLLTQPASNGGEYRQPCKVGFVDDLRSLRIRGSAGVEDDVLPVGTMVRVRRGPFAEKVALVTMSTPDRVRLLLEAFNREVAVEFALDAVEVIRRPLYAARGVDFRV